MQAAVLNCLLMSVSGKLMTVIVPSVCWQLVVLPVLAARHPDLAHLFVCRRRSKGDPGCRSEQRDLPLFFQPITPLLPGQLQRAAGIYLALRDKKAHQL